MLIRSIVAATFCAVIQQAECFFNDSMITYWDTPLAVTPGFTYRANLLIFSPRHVCELSAKEFQALYRVTTTRPIWMAPELELKYDKHRFMDDTLDPGQSRLVRVNLENAKKVFQSARDSWLLFSKLGEWSHKKPCATYHVDFNVPIWWRMFRGSSIRLKLRKRGKWLPYFRPAQSRSQPIKLKGFSRLDKQDEKYQLKAKGGSPSQRGAKKANSK